MESDKAPVLQQGFESDAWNMSKAVAKKKRKTKEKKIPALKEYVDGIDF